MGAKMQKKKKKKRERETESENNAEEFTKGYLKQWERQWTQNKLYRYNICVFHYPKCNQKFALVQLRASDFYLRSLDILPQSCKPKNYLFSLLLIS